MRTPLPGPVIALLFFAGTFLSRVAVLNRSVLDWDESLYFLMARQWRLGALPYTTIWDNKPVGIYAIFALFQAVFGDGVIAMRLATVVFVSALAFVVFKITENLSGKRMAAWVAGGAVVLCALSNDGLSANTELFMACFTALAVWAALAGRSGFVVGLCLGAAFMVKYVAICEAPVVLAIYLSRQPRIGAFFSFAAGAALPLLAAALLYAVAGKFGLWWECSVISNLRRANAPVTQAALDYIWRTELWRWGVLYAAGLTMIGAAVIKRRRNEIFLACWLLAGMLGVAAAKSFYDHYFLQILPVLCVILGMWFVALPRRVALQAGFVLVALALPGWAAATALKQASVPDRIAEAGADLRAQHPASLYVFNSQPILYALTNTTPPTRYVLPSVLTGKLLPGVAGVDPVAEVARILATKPQFIVTRTDATVQNPAVYAELDQALAQQYGVWRKYPGVMVYKLKQ